MTGVAKARKEGCEAKARPRGERVEFSFILLMLRATVMIVFVIARSAVPVDIEVGYNLNPSLEMV